MSKESQKSSESVSDRDNDEIDLLALLWVLLRGWKMIVIFALLGLTIGVLYSRYVNPTFQADALLQLDDQDQGISALGSNISELVAPQVSKADTEAELIRSRMILEPVVNLLHLRIRLDDQNVSYIDRIKRSRTNTQINTAEGVALKTDKGQANISQFDVSQAYLNRSFTLVRTKTGFLLSNGSDNFKGLLNKPYKFKGVDGTIQITVNDLPSIQYPISITKQSLQSTISAINSALSVVEKGPQTGVIQMSLTGQDQKQVSLILKQIVLSYVDQNQSRGSEETTKTITFMETQIPALKKKLETSEVAFNEFRKKYGTIDVAKEAELLVTESYQIDSQLNELKLKKAELTTYYTEEHPLVVQINDQLKVLNDRKKEIDATVGRLPEIQREFLKLSEDVNINREIYLTMLKNYEQLKIVKAGQIGFARIIDLPISTFNAIAPKKLQIWILAMLLGGMLGTMLVLFKNLFRNVVKDPDNLESKTGVPVIATVPRSKPLLRLTKNKSAPNRLLTYIDQDSLSYEAIKSLRTSLMFGMPGQDDTGSQAKVILISGESPKVGKSFIAANLTEAFAQLNKRVLIMDADMRLGELHKIFKIEQTTGLAEYFSQDDVTVAGVVHHTNINNIDFMPRGQHPHDPSSLLASDKFGELMAKLMASYDYIVIDSPPILAASDAIILSQHADKVLVVTRYNDSSEGQLAYAIKRMNKADVQVDGIILNDIQQGIMDKHSYHYSYAYGKNR
ncbi:MAG: polysaccharide biosynthesis tyrosine autokinase [Psychrobacter sp.]|uniref:polysaccharide biosynthesis tyrosine autokinase n=2 Tax=unclassified Psychrobacter TaxID=196806 RepID=UPI0017880EEA|nr:MULTISPECIES: polysaccharide biosynthesis tyrosine autokinase [unclassified Psychrobacter]MBE0442853.1 polysaccharide biosynthesis tyrosine autokinase [Psychrobacter sp. FME13]